MGKKLKTPCEYCIERRYAGCAGMCKDFQTYASKLKKPKQSKLEYIKWTRKTTTKRRKLRMSKHILILEIPGVMRGSDLLEKPREKRVTVFVSNVVREIGFYKQLLDMEKAEHIKEATRFILAMLENVYAVISRNQDLVDNKRMHWIILRNVNRVIGQIGFREKVSVDEEEIALYKEVREDLMNLFEDYLGH